MNNPTQVPSNQRDVSASEPTSYVVEGNTYRELIAERDQLRVHLRQKSEQITRLQDGIEKMQQGSAESGASQPPNDGWSALCEAVAKADPVNYRSPTHEPPAEPTAYLDEKGRVVTVGANRYGGFVGDYRAVPNSWTPLYRAAQPPAPARKCHHAFDVLVITTAYESGFGHGQNLDGLPNPYAEDSPEHHAYSTGYEEGERRRRANGSSGYCNQGAHEHCTNIGKQCMCKCHSPTKEGGQ